MPTPSTSITLLKDLARGTDCARWTEFVRIYEEPMRAFLRVRFPSVDADDVLQETLIALTKRMPGYHYTPDSNVDQIKRRLVERLQRLVSSMTEKD